MFKPVPMRKIHVLILERYVDALTRALGESGYVHLIDAAGQSRRHLLDQVRCQDSIDAVNSLLQRCLTLMQQLGIDPHASLPTSDGVLQLAEIDALLGQAEQRYAELQQATQQLFQEASSLDRQAAHLGKLPFQNISFEQLRDLNYLYIASGRLAPTQLGDTLQALGDQALIMHDYDAEHGSEQLLVVAPRKQRWSLDDQLSKLNFQAEPLPQDLLGTPQAESVRLRGRLGEVQGQIADHRAKLTLLGNQYREALLAASTQLQTALAISQAQQHFGRSAHLYCISGWIPEAYEPEVRRLIEATTAGSAVVEVFAAEDANAAGRQDQEQVPVLFGGSWLLKPFQILVTAYGAPRYDEVEPSLFVAFSFVIMFGIMFGDVGQGAVIAGLGLYLMRTRRPRLALLRNAGIMLLFCGTAAMLFGFLYGSIFGYEHLLPALWLQPLNDVIALSKAAIGVGIACISLGMLINVYNKLRAHRFLEGVLDRFGVIGIVFYWGSLGLGAKAIHAGKLGVTEFCLVIVLPLLILFLREPLSNLLRHRKHLFDHDLLSFVLDGAVETLETVTTFLGSTVSFVRVGGFALSHAALCLAIYALADMLADLPAAGLWQFLLIAAGNILVIVLEGMVATIQGIRLQYYELFSKYFAGDGVLYKPFQLRSTTTSNQGNR